MNRVLIADDEMGMRLIIRKSVEKHENFTIIGEAANGQQVVEMAESLSPDIIFIDIDMPVINGIDAAKKILDINPKTKIIFATAHQEYMKEAFELYAFDYLLKPFKIERIEKTINRIKELDINRTSNIIYEKPNKRFLDKLMIKNKDGINFVDIEDIILIQREDRLTAIYTKNGKLFTSDGLNELEEKLDKNIFLRSHKSYIINLSKIIKIQNYGRWTYIVNFRDTAQDALITSGKFSVLEEMFKLK